MTKRKPRPLIRNFSAVRPAPYALSLAAQVASVVCALVSSLAAARALGPEARGELAIFQTSLSLISIFTFFSFNDVIVRLNAVARLPEGSYFLSVVPVSAICATFLGLILSIVIGRPLLSTYEVFAVFAAFAACHALQWLSIGVLQARGDVKKANAIRHAPLLFFAVLAFVLLIINCRDWKVFLYTQVFAMILTAMLAFRNLHPWPLTRARNATTWKGLVHTAVQCHALTVITNLSVNLDRVLVVVLEPPVSAGFLVVAQSLALLPSGLLGSSIGFALQGEFSKKASFDQMFHLKQALKIAIPLLLTASALTFVLAPYVILFGFGEAFTEATAIVPYILASSGSIAIRSLILKFLMLRGKHMPSLLFEAMAFVIALLVAPRLHVYFGLKGILAGTMVASLLGLAITMIHVLPLFRSSVNLAKRKP